MPAHVDITSRLINTTEHVFLNQCHTYSAWLHRWNDNICDNRNTAINISYI